MPGKPKNGSFVSKTKESKFLPTAKTVASVYDPEEDIYYDIYIHTINSRKGVATISEQKNKNERWEVPTALLGKPLNPDVNSRFKYMAAIARLAVNQDIRAAMFIGAGGIGKTHTVMATLAAEEMVEGKDYVLVKGHVTPYSLYSILYENRGNTVIFDDADSVFAGKDSGNILKACLDSYAKRTVSWHSARSSIPTSFNFTGSIIFISNMDRAQFEDALLSRTVVVDLYMNAQEKMERIKYLANHIDSCKKLAAADRNKIVELMDKYKNTIKNLNVRTLIKACDIFKHTGDLDLVLYQMLNI